MSKNKEFDFSREEDQKRFEQLPAKEQAKEIASAQEQLNFMLQKVQSGEANNYYEAEAKYETENKNNLEDLENLHNQENIKNNPDREKTPEEKRQENIDRLTKEAQLFIAQKKEVIELRKAQKKAEKMVKEEAEKEKNYQEKELPIEVHVENRKKGFVEKMKDKLLLRKFKKAGIENPQKAFELYEYVKREIAPNFQLNENNIEIIKQNCAVTNDPTAFYEKLNSIVKVHTIFNTVDPRVNRIGLLMKKEGILEKLELLSLTMKTLGLKRGDVWDDDIVNFCGNAKIQSEMTPEVLNKIRKLLDLSGERFHFMSNLPKFLDVALEDDAFSFALKVLEESDKKYDNLSLLAARIKKLKEKNFLGKILIGEKVNLDLEFIENGADYYRGDSDLYNVEKLKLEESAEDIEFQKFSTDFAVLQGKSFNYFEFQRLQEIYQDHGNCALAFFEAFRKFGIARSQTKEGLTNFSLDDFARDLSYWKNETTSSPETFFILLDPEFEKEFTWLLSIRNKNKKYLNVNELSEFVFVYLHEKDLLEKMKTIEGEELLQYCYAKNIDPFLEKKFFESPERVWRLKKLDKFFAIDEHSGISEFCEICSSEEKTNQLVEFLERANLRTEKFRAGELPLLYRLQKIQEHLNFEYFRKHSDFFFTERIISFLENNPEKSAELFSLAEDGFLENKEDNFRAILLDKLIDILSISREKRGVYMDLFQKIDKSPSQEIQRVKRELLNQIIKTDDPLRIYEKVEEVFIKNNLPQVGKIFRVFSMIHSPEEMDKILAEREYLSPCLREASKRKRYFTIYKDLINIHVKSGNRSLKNYLKLVQDGQEIFDRIEKDGAESLTEDEKKQAEALLSKMKTLWENTRPGGKLDAKRIDLESGIEASYLEMKGSIGAKEKQTVTERISQMFLVPAEYGNIDEVLEKMDMSKKEASERGKEIAKLLQEGKFNLKNGDLIKGVSSEFLGKILQSGAVAREFLGSSADSDVTPYDSDVLKIGEVNDANSFSQNIQNNFSLEYGGLNLVVRDRGQFFETTQGNSKDYNSSKLELFNSGIVSGDHYGIRTGFSSTEIDLIITSENSSSNERRMAEIGFEIAKNGFYIPIVSQSGELIFSPEKYEEYRKFFNGLGEYEGKAMEFLPTKKEDNNFAEINEIKKDLSRDRENVRKINSEIQKVLSAVLEKHEIKLKDKWDSGILGAEIMNTGSTARHTNLPNDYDFDLILRLDSEDMQKVPAITEELKNILKPSGDDSHADDNDGFQLRAKGATGIDGNPMDIDVGFVKKSEVVEFGSHDAVAEKLEWIENNISEDACRETIANIICAKKILKEGNAYKKFEDGGIGGIGVENWILANKGNMMQAFGEFYKNAHDENGNLLSLSEFQKKYQLLDPGINMKFSSHDNFIGILKENGYNAMIEVIVKYLKF